MQRGFARVWRPSQTYLRRTFVPLDAALYARIQGGQVRM